uniref:Serine/threonine-protein kinase ATR n=1 Tax=Panagrellus redivivus TaxID=6233 RepID=A0A7E4W381_PANRE
MDSPSSSEHSSLILDDVDMFDIEATYDQAKQASSTAREMGSPNKENRNDEGNVRARGAKRKYPSESNVPSPSDQPPIDLSFLYAVSAYDLSELSRIMKDDEERQLLYKSLDYVIARADALSRALQDEAVITNHITPQDCIECCRAIKMMFIDSRNYKPFATPDTRQCFAQNLDMVLKFIYLLREFNRFPEECLLWLACALIDLRGRLPIEDVLGGVIVDHAYNLCRNLSGSTHECFLALAVQEIWSLYRGEKDHLCLNAGFPLTVTDFKTGDHFVVDAFAISIDETQPYESKTAIVQTVFFLLADKAFNYTSLSEPMAAMACEVFLKTVNDCRLAYHSISFLHRFLNLKLMQDIHFVCFLDCMIAYLQLIYDSYDQEPVADQDSILQSIFAALIQVNKVTEIGSDEKLFETLTFNTYLPFVRRLLPLVQYADAHNLTPTILVCRCLDYFREDVHWYAVDLVEPTTALMHNLVLRKKREEREEGIPMLITSLFNFLAKLCGDSHAVGIVDSIVKEVDQMKYDSLYVRQVFIKGLTLIPAAAEFLGSIVPNEEHMLSIMEELKTSTDEYSERLTLAMSITSALCQHYKGSPDTLISFLSLPWICDIDWSTWEHFQKSFPLLVPIKLREDELRTMLSATDLQQCSIQAIARIPYKNEWRTHLFKHVFALPASPVVVAALKALHLFCASMPSFSFFDEIEPLMAEYSKKCLETKDAEVLDVGCALFNAVTNCLCIQSKDVEFKELDVKCAVCDGDKGKRQSVAINIPASFFDLCRTAVAVNSTEFDIKFGFNGALCAIFRHVKDAMDAKEELINISVDFLNYGEPVSTDYKRPVIEFVRSGMSTRIGGQLRDQILQLPDEESQVDYFCCIAEHSPDSLGKQCLADVIAMACIRTERNVRILNKARNVIIAISVRDGIRPKTLFIRDAYLICRSIAQVLMAAVHNVSEAPEIDHDTVIPFIVEGCLCSLSSVFSLNLTNNPGDVLRAWLEIGINHIVPHFFLSSGELAGSAEFILKHFVAILDITQKDLVKQSLPNIFFIIVGVRKRSWNNVLVKRIEQFSEVSFATLVRYEAFKVTATLVLCLGLSENTVMSHLIEVFKHTNEEAEFTMTDCVKPYYLGILLSIRRAFADDMYFNYREMICRSVARLITLLDNAFLTQSPSKMFAVLRAATPKCESIVDAWIRLLEKIDTEVLKDILHQVLFAVAPLSTFQGASRVFKILQEIRKEADPNSDSCLRFDRAVEVLDCPESPMLYLLPPCSIRSRENPLRSCAKMLIEETSDTYILVLPRMLTLIDEHVKYGLMREVMESLLSALKCNSCPDTMKLIALCLGRCGAVDPGRLGMSAYGDPLNTTSTHLYFIDDRQQFFKDVLKICVRCLLEYADADNVDFISFAIQEVLKELGTHDQLESIVLNSLDPWIRFEVLPFRGTSFKPSLHEKLFEDIKPLVSRSQTYDEWLSRWYYTASDRIRANNGRVFRTLQYIFFTGSARLAQDLISKVILQALVEGNADVLNDAVLEIQTVFALAVTDEYDWIRMATHTCFKLIEYIEKYHYFRMAQDIDTSHRKIGARIEEFLATVLSTVKQGGITLLAVDVSNKYNSPCRALRWQEQYGLVHCNRGFPQFNRDAFYVLEKLYREVRDTDSVMGAYSCINKHTSLRLSEQTVAFEAIGNYTAALPLYEQEPLQAVPLVRCFLELNQPISAFSMVPLFLYNTTDDNERRELLDCQYEAAFRQGNWDFLAEQLKRRDDSYVSWGSQIAAVLSSIHSRCEDDYDTRIERARFEAVTALQALTLEDIDTYTQCYNFVQRLHVLSEIDDAVNSLDLLDDVDVPIDELEKLVERWDIRSENAVQSPSVLEPIYTTRTAILKMTTPPESSKYVCQYLLESSKLSRAAGHLSTAWTRIVEARGLEIEDDICIDIEESRYLSLNNQVGEAITLLQKSLAKNFPDLIQQMEAVNKKCRDSQTQIKFLEHLKTMQKEQLTSPVPRQDAFVNAQLQLTEFMEKAKANSHDIYQRYYFLDRFSKNNEHQLYKFALFFDNTFYLNNEANFDVNMFLICLYRRVLAAGKRYLLHVMPRMLTVWLDFANINENLDEEKQYLAKKRRNEPNQKVARIIELTNCIINAFQSLDHFYFFTAYPQLISRLCISSDTVWVTLETMIVELIMEYPHECMWQTVSSLRADLKTQMVRQKKIKRLCQTIVIKSRKEKKTMDFEKLIQDYSNVAKELVDVCFAKDKDCLPGVHHNFNTQFRRLAKLFADPRTKVSVPFITMVEKRLPTFNASQISMPNSETDDTVYITGFENDFHVYSSLEMPKRITMIGSNGMRYPLIAKPKDELRKDASCEDLFRTINIFLLRDAEARRRQLHIRTYSVIPLQAMGGLIEFLPNLVSLRSPMGQKSDLEKNTEERWHAAPRGSRDRVRLCRNLLDKSGVKMAKWFRQTYPDPSKWYAARLAFTRTAATMSMVGFILGLGDRHCENILIDVTTGDCVHVDFNCIFNRTDFLPVPDYVPFRLTPNMRDAFGPNGVEGCFRIACETVLRILREEKSTMFSVLETFIHDPLLEFCKIDKRNHQLRNQKDDDKKEQAQMPGDIQNELALIRARLDGKVVGIKLNPLTKTSAALSVEGQVAQLIETATDIRSLEQMFIGWSPHY